MNNRNNNSNHQDLDDLLRQVDALLDEDSEDWYEDEIDVDEYAPEDSDPEEDVLLYQNYSNNYGRNVANFANGYGGRMASQEYPESSGPAIPAYNADFQPRRERRERYPQMGQKPDFREDRKKAEYRDFGEPELPEPERRRKKDKKQPPQEKPRKKRGCGCSTLLILLAMVGLCLFGISQLFFAPPKTDDPIGFRKRDTAAILICGTDEDGTRTDTMMLMYLSGSERKVGLLSLPRDTYTITSAGYAAKLNSAYGRNGCGEEGMEGLLDYVQDMIGYRPDGYVLLDFELIPQVVDLFGGVDVEVPNAFDVLNLHLDAGMQHLDGQQVLALLRHRATYANADLGRVEVQRAVVKACMDQWIRVDNVKNLFSAMDLVQNHSISSLSTRNYLWIGMKILTNLKNFTTETLPGYATYVADASYYVLYPDQVAEMIQNGYNPYQKDITSEMLNIAG